MKRMLVCVAMALSLFTANAVAVSSRQNADLSPQDKGAVRAIMEKYRTAWLSNDPGQVRSVFTPDAVIMPHHGLPAAEGMKAINEFWFPPGTAKTTILKYVRPIDEVGGDGVLAYVRGRSEIAWRVDDKGKMEEWGTSGTFMAVLQKQPNGTWLIARMIWDDLPNQRTK